MSDVAKTRRSVLGAPSAPARGAGRPKMSIVVVEDPAALADYVPAWQELAGSAIEPNVFYEPWMLLPAIQAYAGERDLRFVFVQASDPADPSATPMLCGVFPLERKRRYHGLATALPLANIGLWKHPFCYLCTPLVRAEHAAECLAAFFDWLAAGSHGCSLMEFGFIAGDGPFWQLLSDHCERHLRPHHVSKSFLRALFQPRGDAETFLRAALQPGRLRELRRHERRLADAGPLEYSTLEPGHDVDAWIDEYLAVESISWKGRGGRALAGNPVDQAYFRTVAREGFGRGQLLMLALRSKGRTLAHKCNFLSGTGSFAFKIAFDEEFARHSPGVLLEIENIRWLHARPEIRWMDSCADAAHPMLDRLWSGRRTIQDVVVGTGGPLGDWFVAALPLLRHLKRKLFRRDPPRQRLEDSSE